MHPTDNTLILDKALEFTGKLKILMTSPDHPESVLLLEILAPKMETMFRICKQQGIIR